MKSIGSGTYKGKHTNKDGKEIIITLQNVLVVPKLWINLFSITKVTELGGTVLCEKDLITVKMKTETLHFTTTLNHGDGSILATDILPLHNIASVVLPKQQYDYVHKALGHPHKQKTIDTARYYNINMTEQSHPCVDCALGKMKVKNFGHDTRPTTTLGEKIHMDITSVNYTSFGGAKFWLMLQDSFTSFVWSFFLKQKSDLATTVISWLQVFTKQFNHSIKKIRCDNAGENKALESQLQQHETFKIQFEYIKF